MSLAQLEPLSLPEHYRPVLLRDQDRDAALAVCVLSRTATATVAPLIVLRETVDATIYLGCLVDQARDPKGWLELWVQNLNGLPHMVRSRVEPWNNAWFDRRWSERLAVFRKLDRENLIETGYETRHPAPALIDPEKDCVVAPTAPSGRGLRLCQDEKALSAAGLPSYASTLHRYLWDGGDPPTFVAVTGDAPTAGDVVQGTDWLEGLLPFNPGGGLLLVRTLSPLRLIDYGDVLSGEAWAGYGPMQLNFGAGYVGLHGYDPVIQRGAHLFHGRSGSGSRLLETLHLKLNLILQILLRARDAVREQQAPFLSLGSESFRVRLAPTSAALPFFWTARVDLVEPAYAFPLAVETSDQRYFLPAEISGSSVFRPRTVSLPASGDATVRIRRVFPPVDGGTSLEATLETEERLQIAASDLIHLRINVGAERIDLFGRVDESQALAKGETRLRTFPQKLTDSTVKLLKDAEGAPMTNASFELLPLLSSPCDLYALGVLAIRILLVDAENSLPIALDETLSLAQQVEAEYDREKSFPNRLRLIVDRDPRWSASLGPHRLTRDRQSREIANQVIPSALWWETVGAVIRLFPGVGPDSFCRDFGDAPALALEKIFDEPVAEFEGLQLRSRSLVISDWPQNLEIQEAIEDALSAYNK
jgi:hypothetical protein